MAELKDIQSEELKMMKILDRICRENDLHYSMIGGTMLGAVRHRGFIPWDDDIDVYMPYEDCLKLKKLFQVDGYTLQTPDTDIEEPFLMYKIRKDGTYMQEPGCEKLHMHQGIWLDIFPYSDCAKSDRRVRFQNRCTALLQTYRCRYRYTSPETRRPIHYLLSKLPMRLQLALDHALEKKIMLAGSPASRKIFAIDPGAKHIHEKRYFEEQAEYTFEDASFFGPKDYDGYLSFVYGADYMTPRQWSHLNTYEDVKL